MAIFAVIDTETNWANQVMSIGTVLADSDTFQPVSAKYHILTPECEVGGMFYEAMFLDTPVAPRLGSRKQVMDDLLPWLSQFEVASVFAYNACFDRRLLPELGRLDWYDILRLAAYRQYNPKIPATAECCSTGRLKRSYGVEPMLRLLSGNSAYRETHNALFDALDELEIMRLLRYGVAEYKKL